LKVWVKATTDMITAAEEESLGDKVCDPIFEIEDRDA
jgi:hypothetical protein